MYAELEVDDEVLKFINEIQDHVESFEEIQELVFTKKRLSKQCNAIEMMNLTLQFQKIKHSAINKILNHEKLNFPEGFLIERLIAKYNNDEYISVEEHFKNIESNCGNNRETKRKNQKRISKLYNKFLNSCLAKSIK